MEKKMESEKLYQFGVEDFVISDVRPDELGGYGVRLVRDRMDDGAPSTIEEHFNDAFTVFLEDVQRFKNLSQPITDEKGSELIALLSGLISAQQTLRTAEGMKGERLVQAHEKRIEETRRGLDEKAS